MGATDILPSGGKEFSHLGFKKKLKVAVKNNHIMSAVADNQDAINKAVYRYRGLISKGNFNHVYQRTALKKIKAESPLSAHQTVVVKKVLKRLGESAPVSHARVNREEDNIQMSRPGFAQANSRSNITGLSGLSKSNLKQSAQPMVSISQARNQNRTAPVRSTGLAGGFNNGFTNSAPSSRPPIIPLSR
ncbi:hypothetical protein JXE04_00365 [Patescibacteria group bacterium]|nr:hypothetical protein [Patescibacteria group bacterium]